MNQRVVRQRVRRVEIRDPKKDKFDRELTTIVQRAVENVAEKVGSVLRKRAPRREDEIDSPA